MKENKLNVEDSIFQKSSLYQEMQKRIRYYEIQEELYMNQIEKQKVQIQKLIDEKSELVGAIPTPSNFVNESLDQLDIMIQSLNSLENEVKGERAIRDYFIIKNGTEELQEKITTLRTYEKSNTINSFIYEGKVGRKPKFVNDTKMIQEIKKDRAAGMSIRDLAKKYKSSVNTIQKIIK